MTTGKDFAAFYEKELSAVLGPLEAERKKVKQNGTIGFIFLGLALLSFIINTSTQEPAIIALLVICLLIAIVFLILFGTGMSRFTKKFKEQVVRKIIAFIDPALSYTPGRYISKKDYKNSGLYIGDPDRYSGDDYMEGMHEKTIFCFSELHTQRRVQSGKTSHWVTIFKGLFFMADFNKNFSGRTYVWSENRPQLNFLMRWFSSFAHSLEKVSLESKEFEDRFVVYSTDQVEARYILTPSFMERAVRLQQMMGEGVSMSFVDTNIHVAVPIRDDLFEPAVFTRNDFSRLEDFRTTLGIVYDIMDELKLEQRLWTKE